MNRRPARPRRPAAPRRKQRTITVDETEGAILEGIKRLWQNERGQTDWGKVLVTLAIGGLVINHLQNARPADQQPAQWLAQCPACAHNFPVEGLAGTARYEVCPNCRNQFLVYDPRLVPNQ